MPNYIPISLTATILGVCTKTIRRWNLSGILYLDPLFQTLFSISQPNLLCQNIPILNYKYLWVYCRTPLPVRDENSMEFRKRFLKISSNRKISCMIMLSRPKTKENHFK